MRSILQRSFAWLPTITVLAVVLIAGSRLIYLSVQQHAALAHEAAAGIAATFVRKIEPPLQKLDELAGRQAAWGARLLSEPDAPSSIGSVPTAKNSFWMTASDKVLRAQPLENETATSIAGEWQAAESARAIPGSAVLGPMRLGSQWIVAIRYPVAPRGSEPTARPWAWSVAYADFEELTAESHLIRLIDMGYDFELAQVEPRSTEARIFVSSSSEPLHDGVAARIRLPTAAAVPGSYLEMMIRPHSGWYPASLLTSEIGLLAFLAWLLAFGTHDLIHALQRSRAALAASRRRLHLINQHLAGEIKQRLALQETFDHARFHDAFTGLPNRRFFMDQLDRALRDLRTKRRRRIAVIIVDIARFKLINNMLGHTAADELMVQAARRFEQSIAAVEGMFARWSGDQFALLILDVASTEAALEIVELLQEKLRSPFRLRRHQLLVGAAVGVTCVDLGQQRAEDVVRQADIALSVAKRQEGVKVVPYAPSMWGQAASMVSLEADLHVALEKHQLQLVFQPIVDLRTYTMAGGEALLRWLHPVEGLLGPDSFLHIAEETGLMVPITRWIILRVVAIAGEWLRAVPANQKFHLSINLSPTALRDPGLSEFVASVMQATQLPPSLLKFELTEAALVGNVGVARETLDRLHGMGIQLMLDDFGTGYSSLSNLQLFPFDFVKIDRPFLNRTGSDQANMKMMGAMMQIAGSLNLTAIAELIETETAAKALHGMGCNYGQGYYFSEPIEADLALQWLRTQEPFQPPPTTSATMMVRPGIDRHIPARSATSETMRVRTLEEDTSPTIIVQTSTIDFSSDDEPE
jgi:diguanylate cyclase (GGDEF)-like protein